MKEMYCLLAGQGRPATAGKPQPQNVARVFRDFCVPTHFAGRPEACPPQEGSFRRCDLRSSL